MTGPHPINRGLPYGEKACYRPGCPRSPRWLITWDRYPDQDIACDYHAGLVTSLVGTVVPWPLPTRRRELDQDYYD